MKKILVVDDIPVNLELIKLIIEKNLPDYKVLLAGSGKEALEIASQELPDTILLDIYMPEIDGFEVCRTLKNDPHTANIPVLMVSAFGSNPEFRVKGLQMGADAFITKPFDHSELLALINVMLRIKNAEDLLKSQNRDLEIQITKQLNEFSQKEHRLFQISDFVNEFFWEVDENLLFTYVSTNIENILGYSIDALRHQYHLFDFVHKHDLQGVKELMLKIVNEKKTFNRNKIHYRKKDGNEIWLLLNGFPYFDQKNQLLGYRGVCQNITQQIRDEEKHTMVINTSIDGFIMTDSMNRILEVNDAYCKLTGYSNSELIGRKYNEIDQFAETMNDRLIVPDFYSNNYTRYESKHLGQNDRIIDVEVSVKYINIIENQKFIFVRDISDRKLIEDEKAKNLDVIQIYQKNLKNLHHRLITAEEKEKKQIAEYLHDGIGQNLAIAYLKLSSIPQSSEIKTNKIIQETLVLIDKSIKETRSLTYDLSPTVLYELGLVSAFRWKIDSIRDEFSIKISLVCYENFIAVSNETAILLYRIFSELLANIIKHANATDVQTIICQNQNTLIIDVIDNGKGFDQKDISSKPIGFGLFSIRERLDSINGTLEIQSEINKGTKVKLVIPN